MNREAIVWRNGSRGGVNNYRRRGDEATKSLAPVAFRLGQVVRAEPLDVVAVGTCSFATWYVAPAERVIGGEELREDTQARAAIEQRMVGGPDEPVVRLIHAKKCQPHERRPKLKASPAIDAEVAAQSLLALARIGPPPPVVLLDGGTNTRAPPLQELARVLDKADVRAQHRVPIYDPPPRLPERRDTQLIVQRTDELLDVHAGARGTQRMEQHALLKGRERVRICGVAGRAHVVSSLGPCPPSAASRYAAACRSTLP